MLHLLLKFIILCIIICPLPFTATSQPLDNVVAIIGNNAIMLSDVEQEIFQIKAQGTLKSGAELFCEVFEQQMINKLFLTQAKIDSLPISEGGVDQMLEQRINFFITQMGNQAEVEKYFSKPLYKLKEELRVRLEEQNLIQQMQGKITEAVHVSPYSVSKFYETVNKDSLPVLPDQYVLQQLMLHPPSVNNARLATRERLLELRERIIGGDKFQTLARLYSEDPGSARRGGELGLSPRTQFVKPFADAAFGLKTVGQVSHVVETEYGYHILQLIEREGDLVNVRHILLKPQYSSDVQQLAITKLDSIANLIRKDSMSFEMAVMRFSQDEKSRLNGGYLVNAQTLSRDFDKEHINPPTDFYTIKTLKEGEVSNPFTSQDGNGQEVYKIIKVKKFTSSHTANLKQDYTVITDIAKNHEQQKLLKTWITKTIGNTYINIMPKYRDCNFENKEWFIK